MSSEELRARFLAGMSHAAATVSVVTSDGPAGRAGVTVSAMTSVSADAERPTLLVCVHRDSTAAAAILANGVYCVNVLRDDQTYISDTFAGRFRAQLVDKFDCAEWVPMPSGAPRVIDPLVAFDCRVVSSDLVGTHHVIFGEVGDIFIADRGSPLIYARRAYGAAARIEAAASMGEGQSAAENRLMLGCLQTISAFALPGLFRRLRDEAPEVAVTLVEGDQARIHAALATGEAEIALMHDEMIAGGLCREVLTEFPPHVLLADHHPLAEKQVLSAEDLAGEPMVLLSAPPSPDYLLTLLRAQGVEPRIAYRSSSVETVRGFVGQGLGYAVLAGGPASDLTYDGRRLVRRPLAWPARPSRLLLVRRAEGHLSPAAERFAWLCRNTFGAGPDHGGRGKEPE